MGIFYLAFIKAFDTVSHKSLTEKVMKHRLDDQPVRWTEKRLGPEGGQQWHQVQLEVSD